MSILFLKNFLTLSDFYILFIIKVAFILPYMYNNSMKDLWNYLKENKKPIVLYGMGNGADKVISALDSYNIKVSGVFASDTFVRKKIYKGFEIKNYNTIKKELGDMVVLVCFGTALPDVIDNIKKISLECETYAPDVPVCGGPLFTGEFYEKNLSEIQEVRSFLADEKSVKCFDKIIEYKLTGDINCLFDCETPLGEPYSSFLDLKNIGTFVDLGAYRGDTVLDFLERAGEDKKIIAAEPDKKTFLKLQNNTKHIKNITLINGAVCDINGDVAFGSFASRGSTVTEKSKHTETVKGFTLDSLYLTDKNMYIKADIEGAEAQFIKGAEKTIKAAHPKMRIAAYHKSADIFSIPLAVKAINKDYKVFLRHNPCLPAWDTDYFFI